MYNTFDKELIDSLQRFFREEEMGQVGVTSDIVGDGIYQMRFENSNFVLEMYYSREDDLYEAQIRVISLLLKGPLKRKGLSKRILNALLKYCQEHEGMSLWICDLINRSWTQYLVQHGAVLVRQESLNEGAVVLIRDRLL